MDVQTKNAEVLRERFAATVVGQRPESVLDFGCGSGRVMVRLRDAGVPVVGFEPDDGCHAALREEGIGFAGGAVTARLPWDDGAFDWVVMRHVPHHLEEPIATFAEVARVCRTGMVVAEPWFDRSVSSQAVAEDLDLWLKARHRAAGRVHHPNLDVDALLRLWPSGWDVGAARWERFVALRPKPLADVEAEVAEWVPAADASARAELDELMERSRAEGVSCNGSVTLCVRRQVR